MNGIDAGRLLVFALDVKATPGRTGQSAEYARLVARYLSEETFRQLFDDILEGAGCSVTHASPETGLVLLAEADSAWAWPARSSDLPWGKKQKEEHRAARMLVVPALLAFIAPTAADLEDYVDDHTRLLPDVPVADLEDYIRQFALQQEAANPNPVGDGRPLWWHWVQLPQVRSAERSARTTSTYLVADVLDFLEEQHLAVRRDNRPLTETVYRPRRRLMAHYRDLFLHDLFADLQSFTTSSYERVERTNNDEGNQS
ncbi:hypothetical protein ACIG87_26080 [Micromonospora sp. NPDC051925]|uniref:hypothetical protein n=1 Tax=Micromonospora sp. NPDC051925 TaxID=3364288 RepID=UPI0037C9E790